jgi:hypothetical protein
MRQSLRSPQVISKDSNVNVVAEAIACCGLLASGLRKEFGMWARNLVGSLLEKQKARPAPSPIRPLAHCSAYGPAHGAMCNRSSEPRTAWQRSSLARDAGPTARVGATNALTCACPALVARRRRTRRCAAP